MAKMRVDDARSDSCAPGHAPVEEALEQTREEEEGRGSHKAPVEATEGWEEHKDKFTHVSNIFFSKNLMFLTIIIYLLGLNYCLFSSY